MRNEHACPVNWLVRESTGVRRKLLENRTNFSRRRTKYFPRWLLLWRNFKGQVSFKFSRWRKRPARMKEIRGTRGLCDPDQNRNTMRERQIDIVICLSGRHSPSVTRATISPALLMFSVSFTFRSAPRSPRFMRKQVTRG